MLGLGEVGAKYMIIGEAPGRDEDCLGVPFVGLAGKRLDKLLGAAGISLNDCYITNVCRCRPPSNRTPKKVEVRACSSYLLEEIRLVQPQQIITLGSTPLSLFCPYGIRQMHGTMFDWAVTSPTLGVPTQLPIPVVAQYHPAAALHQPRLWATMLDDWRSLPKRCDTSYILTEAMPPDGATVACDTENDTSGTLGQWSLAWREDGKVYVKTFYGARPNFNWHNWTVVFHNAKWDLRVLKRNGMTTPEPHRVMDTMIAAYTLGWGKQDISVGENNDVGMVGGLGLKYLARRRLGKEMKTWEQVCEDPTTIPYYNADDSTATLLLWEDMRPQLGKIFTIDMPLLDVLMTMEERGVAVDPARLQDYETYLVKQLASYDFPFNPNSPKQLQDYIYGQLKITPWKFTDSKQPSVDSDVLEKIDDDTVRRVVEFKRLYKERNTYTRSYLERMAIDGRIHPEFKQTSTATGRLSSANPNLQNVPKEGAMRSLFIASPGHKLIRMDYSQIELRVFAVLAGEEKFKAAFEAGRDIHQETADALGISRKDGKTINFAMLYGSKEWNLSQKFGITIDQAKATIAKYYRTYPAIPAYFERMKKEMHETKQVKNYWGRIRKLDALMAEDWRIIAEGEREGINMPTQSTAADIVKQAMLGLHYDHRAPMICQVHDELIFEVPDKDALEYAHWLNKTVPSMVTIEGTTFPVEVGIGNNWLEAGLEENKIGS